MKVAGFTIIRNAETYDYPVVEAIMSVLPICDAFYVGLGNSNDATRKWITSIQSNKIIICDSVWDDSLRKGGQVLAVETNKVFQNIPQHFDWCFYLQSDECVHEQDLPIIKQHMQEHLNNPKIEGLLFKYLHFYGSYQYIGTGRMWYDYEIRIIRNNKNIHSYKDAQGFRWNTQKKLQVASIPARIFHYGWVKAPDIQQRKQSYFNRLWHDDTWIRQHLNAEAVYSYPLNGPLKVFKGTHPEVYAQRIKKQNWVFEYRPESIQWSFKNKLLHWIESSFGIRLWNYQNYKRV